MAKLSRNQRHKARQRRNISQANRALKALHARYSNTYLTLLMLLAQKGGEVTVTQGTLQQVVEGVQAGLISWQSFPGIMPNEFIIRLITKEQTDVEGEPLSAADGEDKSLAGGGTEGSTSGADNASADDPSDAEGEAGVGEESFPGSSEIRAVHPVSDSPTGAV